MVELAFLGSDEGSHDVSQSERYGSSQRVIAEPLRHIDAVDEGMNEEKTCPILPPFDVKTDDLYDSPMLAHGVHELPNAFEDAARDLVVELDDFDRERVVSTRRRRFPSA